MFPSSYLSYPLFTKSYALCTMAFWFRHPCLQKVNRAIVQVIQVNRHTNALTTTNYICRQIEDMFYLQVINVNIPVQQHGPSDYRLLCISTIFSNKHVMHTYNCYVIITVSINWLPLLCPPADISMCIHREVSQPLKQLSYSIVKRRPHWSEFAMRNGTRA